MNDLVRRTDPFDLFSRFGDFFEREPFFSPAVRNEWLPPVDIRETDEAYEFHMEVPGMKPEDLDVELHNGVLSIRGSREEKSETKEKGVVRTERRTGSFARQFRVPVEVPADSLNAQVTDGVLSIQVPKGHAEGTKKIPIS